MEGLAILGLLAVLWALVGPAIALTRASRARRQNDVLAERVRLLEEQLAAGTAGRAPHWTDYPVAEPTPDPELPLEPTPPQASEEQPPAGPWVSPPEPQPTGSPPAEPDSLTGEPMPPEPITQPQHESLETRIGARWTVLVGGLALALGAVFLVRYTIEQGLIGPGARIALGALLSAALFAAGEWLRRSDRALELPVFPKADIPAIVTAAAGIAAFATIYSAHALYGFVGPAAAFVLLTLAGLVTLFLSVIHGPALAALGALGSYVAPLLVSSAEPNPLALVMHTLAVTAAVLGMARIRDWRWLAMAGLAGSLAWAVLLGVDMSDATLERVVMIAGLTIVYVLALIVDAAPNVSRDRAPNLYGLAALAGLALLSAHYARGDAAYPTIVCSIVLIGVLGGVASRWSEVAWAAVIGGALAVVTVLQLPVPYSDALGVFEAADVSWNVGGEAALPAFALQAAGIVLVVGVGCFLSADRTARSAPLTAGLFAAAGAGAPLLILVIVYLRHVPFETRPQVGFVALVMAAIFAAMAERLIARRPADDAAPAPALYAAGAVLALTFAMAVGLATRFIPLALSLGATGVVWVSLYRRVTLLPWLAVVVAGLAALAIAVGPPFTPDEIGTRPIFNGLILRLGLPTLAVLAASELLRRRADTLPARILQTIGLVIAALFVATQTRHYANDGVIAAGTPGIAEQGALTMAALAFALGLQRIARQTASDVYRIASLVAGVIGAAMIALMHFIVANPLLTGNPVGTGAFFNALLPGYLLPAIMAAWVAVAARPVRPRWYVLMMAALALALSFAYVTLVVRHGFWGTRLDRSALLDAENWTYSAAWLVFGIVILAAGILLRSTMVRAASGIVIAVVVFKVFLFDMSALTGALRAASFLGLGVVLILIGRLYQRLLTGRAPSAAPSGPD